MDMVIILHILHSHVFPQIGNFCDGDYIKPSQTPLGSAFLYPHTNNSTRASVSMTPENTPVVQLVQGAFRGEFNGSIYVFRGLPYARSSRFGAPTAPPFHDGIQSAVVRGALCPQLPSRLEMVMGPIPSEMTMSEDCQNVSIFSPDLAGRQAVMVWFHGGAYVSGGGEISWYDADMLAAEGSVVVVTVTYRLGAFGYLCPPEEKGVMNAGLLDQVAALEWVQKNIEKFGGDPENITIFGQSAGGHAIAQLINQAPDLFHRCIIQSAPFAIQNTKSQAQEVYQSFTKALGVDPSVATVDQMLHAQSIVLSTSSLALPFSPIINKSDLSSLKQTKPHDMLIGWTKHDGGPFVIMRRGNNAKGYGSVIDRILTAITTSVNFARPARRFARRSREAGNTVALYAISWCPQGSAFGAPHCVELPLLFGNQQAWQRSPMLGTEQWAEIHQRGRNLRAAWTTFAREGSFRQPKAI